MLELELQAGVLTRVEHLFGRRSTEESEEQAVAGRRVLKRFLLKTPRVAGGKVELGDA